MKNKKEVSRFLPKGKKAVSENLMRWIIWIFVFLIALGGIYFLTKFLTNI